MTITKITVSAHENRGDGTIYSTELEARIEGGDDIRGARTLLFSLLRDAQTEPSVMDAPQNGGL